VQGIARGAAVAGPGCDAYETACDRLEARLQIMHVRPAPPALVPYALVSRRSSPRRRRRAGAEQPRKETATRRAELAWIVPGVVAAAVLMASDQARADDANRNRARRGAHHVHPDRDRGEPRTGLRGRITIEGPRGSVTLGAGRGELKHPRHTARRRAHPLRPPRRLAHPPRSRPPRPVHRVWVPGHFVMRTERVLVEPRHYVHRRVPAVWETRHRRGCAVRVRIRPAFVRRIWVPARYEVRHVRVWVPGHWVRRPAFGTRW
jgi:hypothetical protein